MKKLLFTCFFLVLIVGGIAAWLILGSGTAFKEKNKYFVIEQGKTDKASLLEMLEKKYIIKNTTAFSLIASQAGVWEKIKPGKYEVKNGQSLLSIAKMLKNNKQAEMKLVINKLRTKEDFAKLIAKNFIHDSATVMTFLTSNDSLKDYNVDTNTVFTLLIPATYNFYWGTPLRKIFNKLDEAHNTFWNQDRLNKAKSIGFTPEEVCTIASIVEEETNNNAEKGNIASVYINRYHKGMALGADPTVKYALKDFSLKRILYVHLNVVSPYNTYRNKGLPPGPICTPSQESVDAVLNVPQTDYLYFVANFGTGDHHFSSNFAEHIQYAKEYQRKLDEYLAKKQAGATTEE